MSNLQTSAGCRTSSRSKKPSNYAKYIEEYQQQIIPKSIKKPKPQTQQSSEIQVSSGQQKSAKKNLTYILPSGRRLNLEILFSKAKPPKQKPKIKQKIIEEKPIVKQKPTVEKNNLISKFLLAFQQIQKDQKQVENDSVKNVTNSADLPINQKQKEPKQLKKKDKDEDDKFARYFQKMKKLDEKFLQVSQTLIFL